jgi:hypothetical protein
VRLPVNGRNVVALVVRLAEAGAAMLPTGLIVALRLWLPVPVLPLAGMITNVNNHTHDLLLTMAIFFMLTVSIMP